ncbi:MAG: transporter permease [Armatimonadetes bacterium]|jgi:ribose transport system permease protein|nr:transporter permease [Armatimonadota bacterium]
MPQDPTTSTSPAQKHPAVRLGAFLLRFQSLFGLIAIFAISAIQSPINRKGENIFLGPENLLNVLRFASENGIIAIGMTLVILTGGIDLSVGAVLALCAVAAATGLMKLGFGVGGTVLLVLGLGALVGLANGLITTGLRIQSFITTLAMLSAARGAASLWAHGYAVPLAYGPGKAPPGFKSLFAGELPLPGLGMPVQILYFVGVGALAAWMLQQSTFGRHIYAVGSNEAAARLCGIAVNRVKVIVFGISGLLSGLAALLHAALVNQGSHIDGSGYELNAIAAVVIGGTSLAGGTGTVLGTMVGALILSIMDNILGLRNFPSEYQMILKGIVIVFAVVLQRRR